MSELEAWKFIGINVTFNGEVMYVSVYFEGTLVGEIRTTDYDAGFQFAKTTAIQHLTNHEENHEQPSPTE